MSLTDDERSDLKLQQGKYASEIRRISNNKTRKGQQYVALEDCGATINNGLQEQIGQTSDTSLVNPGLGLSRYSRGILCFCES